MAGNDFYMNAVAILNAQKPNNKGFKAVRADLLAKAMGDLPHATLEKLEIHVDSAKNGIAQNLFAVIPARQQESFGFPIEPTKDKDGNVLFPGIPREVMGANPQAKRRTRKAKAGVEAATGQKEAKTYWPIVALWDEKLVRESEPVDDIVDYLVGLGVRNDFDLIVAKDGVRVVRKQPNTETQVAEDRKDTLDNTQPA